METLHNFELTEVIEETADIKTFVFKALDRDFNWQAGQYLDWQLPHQNADDRGERRWFSIASAPSEEVVMLSTRFSEDGSTLKKHLLTLKVGEQIQAKGPMGTFTADSNDTQLVLIAGGIGITPFRAIIKERLAQGTLSNITLVYGNKTEGNVPFKQLFDELALQNDDFKVEYVFGKHIDAAIVAELTGGLDQKEFMISGLEKMVAAIEESLLAAGVKKESIRIDDFGGYDWNIDKPVY